MQPSVIVTDLMMLPTGGVELCERLHGNAVTRNIPVIVYTGVTDPTILVQLCKFGVRVFAIKPCVPTAIGKEAHALLVGRPGSEGVRIVSGYGERLDDFERDIEAAFQHDSQSGRKSR